MFLKRFLNITVKCCLLVQGGLLESETFSEKYISKPLLEHGLNYRNLKKILYLYNIYILFRCLFWDYPLTAFYKTTLLKQKKGDHFFSENYTSTRPQSYIWHFRQKLFLKKRYQNFQIFYNRKMHYINLCLYSVKMDACIERMHMLSMMKEEKLELLKKTMEVRF